MATLGVADSKANVDSGSITGLSTFGTGSGSTVSFYGVTGVTQPADAQQATITATWVTLCATAGFGFLTSNQIISVIATIKHIQYVLKTLGLWKGSA